MIPFPMGRKMMKIQPKIVAFKNFEKTNPALELHKHLIRSLKVENSLLKQRIVKLERDREVVTRATEYYQKLSSRKKWWHIF
jgi:hypothetical protein